MEAAMACFGFAFGIICCGFVVLYYMIKGINIR